MSDREPAERLAIRVADGGAVDWDEADRSAPTEHERRLVRHLKLVESVARVHRSASDSGLASVGERRSGPAEPAIRSWAHLDLLAKLGAGAFGEVYRAWDRRLEREVALKLLKADRTDAQRLASTVIEEGRVLAKLRHPNVVTVYGAEVHDGRVGLWMELIRGRSLAEIVETRGAFGPREAAIVGLDLCRALAAVHRSGVVHRDVKAQNVMREEGGRIVLMDFGTGMELRTQGVADRKISGTPIYMAPEVLRGEPATERSDLYSLGVLLYHLVTRSFPHDAGSFHALREQHARGGGKLLRDQRPDLPEAFIRVVERALAGDAEDRFATAGQMEQALSAALGMESDPAVSSATALASGRSAVVRRSSRVWLGASAALLGIVALGLVLWVRRPAAKGRPAAEPVQAASDATAPAAAAYTVEAHLYRVAAGGGVRERLDDGARLALGDRLQLELQASTSLHVYVIDEDDAGHAYALFPMSGLEPKNPLAAGRSHRLPGTRNGEEQSWVVDTPGGREHFLVLASPTRLVEFEADMNALERPGQAAVPLPESARSSLTRGVGGLAAAPRAVDAAGTAPGATGLFEMAERLASRSETVRGVWMRRIDLENPKAP
jgi:eukaryotic-like serine/threonine-protein kinase